MYGFTTQVALAIACIAIAAAIAACQSAATDAGLIQTASSHVAGSAQQLIVKFKPSAASGFSCDSTGIAHLGAAAGVALRFIRSMSGGACVARQDASGPGELEQGYARLKRHPAVEWVEADALIMKAW